MKIRSRMKGNYDSFARISHIAGIFTGLSLAIILMIGGILLIPSIHGSPVLLTFPGAMIYVSITTLACNVLRSV